MVGGVRSTSNLINMISFNYQQTSTAVQGGQNQQGPPPMSGTGLGRTGDPLGVFESVDTDSDGTISESEYDILSQGILEVTGSELNSSFLDFDADSDGFLNGAELRSVLDEAGFAPPPPPPQQVISAYGAQSGETTDLTISNDPLLAELLAYLENRGGDVDIIA